MDYIKLNQETYDKIAPLFAETRQYIWDDMQPFLAYVQDGDHILDVGCGTGRLYQLFEKNQPADKAERRSVTYIGLDQSAGQIDMAKRDFPNNEFVVAEMTSLPFSDNSFDVVFCIATLHHLPDEEMRVRALAEMKRVVKTGGYILMTNWNLYSDSAQKTVAKGKWAEDRGTGDFIVPWKSPEGETIGERYYHGFQLAELEDLYEKIELAMIIQYYSCKGEKSTIEKGHNIVTVLQK